MVVFVYHSLSILLVSIADNNLFSERPVFKLSAFKSIIRQEIHRSSGKVQYLARSKIIIVFQGRPYINEMKRMDNADIFILKKK